MFRIPMTRVRSVGRSARVRAVILRMTGNGLVAGPVPGIAPSDMVISYFPRMRLIASARVAGLAQLAAHGAGDGLGAGLADPAHRHAQVFALDDDDRAAAGRGGP